MGVSDDGGTGSTQNVPESEFNLAFQLDRKRPASDQVYLALRSAINSVRLLPGTALSEAKLCREFGVSRTPVRAAVQRLIEDELVEVFPQRGTFVAPIRLGTVRDSHYIRRSLELSVLADCANLWEEAHTKEADAIIEKQRASIRNHDKNSFLAADEELHRLFSVVAGRVGVWPTILAAKRGLARLYLIRHAGKEIKSEVIDEHIMIIDAIKNGKVDEACDLLAKHLDKVFEILGTSGSDY